MDLVYSVVCFFLASSHHQLPPQLRRGIRPRLDSTQHDWIHLLGRVDNLRLHHSKRHHGISRDPRPLLRLARIPHEQRATGPELGLPSGVNHPVQVVSAHRVIPHLDNDSFFSSFLHFRPFSDIQVFEHYLGVVHRKSDHNICEIDTSGDP